MKSKLVESTPKSLRLVESKEKRKGCLGRLEGICADFIHPTRNNRLYGLQLWKNVFSNELVQEGLKTKTLFGELDHPEERFECLSKLACVVMTDYNIDEENGVVTGGFDILDTVQGRTLKALLDYGCQMGVSSRGTGDVIENSGVEEVDPDTYEFSCFDVVSTPAVATARQTVVESVHQLNKRKTLLESLNKEIKQCDTTLELNAIENAVSTAKVPNLDSILESIKDRKQILVKESKTITSSDNNSVKLEDNTISNSTAINTCKENTKTISYDKFVTMCETVAKLSAKVNAYKLREKTTAKLVDNYKAQIETLQTKLSESKQELKTQIQESKKVSRLNTSLQAKLKSHSSSLKESANKSSNLSSQLLKTKKELTESKRQLKVMKESITKQDTDIAKLQERLQNSLTAYSTESANAKELKALNESLTAKLNESSDVIESYKLKQTQLKNKISSMQKDNSDNISKLKENINELTLTNKKLLEENNSLHTSLTSTSSDLTNSDVSYNELVDKYNKLLEQYDSLKASKNKLIESNKSYMINYLNEIANKNGINPKAVKLTSDMTVADIKQCVNEAVDRRDRYNKLPFSYEEPTKINVLNEHITKHSSEESLTEQFLQSVQNSI